MHGKIEMGSNMLRQPNISSWMATSVQCVPGGHQISISEAFWCGNCQYYLCYSHAQTSFWVNTIKCPKGHEVTKAT